jgi:hypothetical protein
MIIAVEQALEPFFFSVFFSSFSIPIVVAVEQALELGI